jgi:tetratricopeptide (TPR) repeat protein
MVYEDRRGPKITDPGLSPGSVESEVELMQPRLIRSFFSCISCRSGSIAWFAVVLCLTATLAFTATAQAADPDQAKKVIRQVDKLFRQANYSEAEKLLRTLIVTDPENPLAKLKLAHVLLRRRQVVEAYELSFPVAKADPTNPYALSVVANTLLAAGNFAEARPIFLRAIQLNKREALAWTGLGMIDYYENRMDESLLNLREATFHAPDTADFVFSLAQVSARAEQYKEAADAYQRFLELSSDDDQERRDRIKGLINFLRFLGNKVSLYSTAGKETTKITFELIGNRPVLRVRINGRSEPLNFILDTGSGITVLSEETAKRLKIRAVTRGGFAKGIGGDGKFEIVYGFLREIGIGDVRVRNVPVYIRKFHHLNHKVDGYIGLSLISKFLTTIDYGDLSFNLDRKDSPLTAISENTRSLPLRLTSSGFLSGSVRLDGLESPVNFIVDTGASVSVISDDLAAIEPVVSAEKGQKMRVVGAAGITDNVQSYVLPRLSFGDQSRSGISAVALDLDLINEASGFEQAGILGGNFLKSYRLTFDFKNARVLFDPISERPSETVQPLE